MSMDHHMSFKQVDPANEINADDPPEDYELANGATGNGEVLRSSRCTAAITMPLQLPHAPSRGALADLPSATWCFFQACTQGGVRTAGAPPPQAVCERTSRTRRNAAGAVLSNSLMSSPSADPPRAHAPITRCRCLRCLALG